MHSHADRTQENKSQSVANAVSQKQSGGEPTFQFEDNRPEAIAQRKLIEISNNSPQVKQLMSLQKMANNIPQSKQVVQRVIEVSGDRVYGAGEAEALKTTYPEEWSDILSSLNEFGHAPKTVDEAVSDERHFTVTREEVPDYGVLWNPVLQTVVTEVDGGGKTREAGDIPVLVLRPEENFEELKISGLIMCVGIVIEAKRDDGRINAAAGAHFVTPICIEESEESGDDEEESKSSDNFKINSHGISVLKGLTDLASPHGTLSAKLFTAVGAGEKKSIPEKQAEQAVELITKALSMPVTVMIGESTRNYQLDADGTSAV